MARYIFDGTMTGLLSCIFSAFQFKEFNVLVSSDLHVQSDLFDDSIDVASNDEQAQRVWQGLKQKVSAVALKRFYYSFLSEQNLAFQHCFNFAVCVFQSQRPVDQDYGHTDVLSVSQWAKQVGWKKHRVEAFVRLKKCKDGLFLSLISPDFNVLPIIEGHFKRRYQDQRWQIYDEKCKRFVL